MQWKTFLVEIILKVIASTLKRRRSAAGPKGPHGAPLVDNKLISIMTVNNINNREGHSSGLLKVGRH